MLFTGVAVRDVNHAPSRQQPSA